MENNKNKKSVKFQGDVLNFCDFIQVFVFPEITTLNKLQSRGFRAPSLSTYDFSTLYTTLPHNLIKDKLVDLIERTFQRKGMRFVQSLIPKLII